MIRRRFLLSLGTGMTSLATVAVCVLTSSQVPLVRANLVSAGAAAAQAGGEAACCEACPDCPPGDVCPACSSALSQQAGTVAGIGAAALRCCGTELANPAGPSAR